MDLAAILYYVLFTGLRQTPGKMLLGIKVVNSSGDPPGLGIAFIRGVIGKLLSALVLFLGFFWMRPEGNQLALFIPRAKGRYANAKFLCEFAHRVQLNETSPGSSSYHMAWLAIPYLAFYDKRGS